MAMKRILTLAALLTISFAAISQGLVSNGFVEGTADEYVFVDRVVYAEITDSGLSIKDGENTSAYVLSFSTPDSTIYQGGMTVFMYESSIGDADCRIFRSDADGSILIGIQVPGEPNRVYDFRPLVKDDSKGA